MGSKNRGRSPGVGGRTGGGWWREEVCGEN